MAESIHCREKLTVLFPGVTHDKARAAANSLALHLRAVVIGGTGEDGSPEATFSCPGIIYNGALGRPCVTEKLRELGLGDDFARPAGCILFPRSLPEQEPPAPPSE